MRERKSENCLDKCGAASRAQSFKLNRIDSHLLFIKISWCCYGFWLQINTAECNDSSVFPLVTWPALSYIPWELSLKWGGTWTSCFTGKHKLSSLVWCLDTVVTAASVPTHKVSAIRPCFSSQAGQRADAEQNNGKQALDQCLDRRGRGLSLQPLTGKGMRKTLNISTLQGRKPKPTETQKC